MNFVKLLGLNCVMAQEDQNSYNILAMDGGAIRGIITAACIDKIEQYAYTHAIAEDLSIPRYKYDNGTLRERIPMKDLFDLISGTSTGSMLASGLSVQKPGSEMVDGFKQPMFYG